MIGLMGYMLRSYTRSQRYFTPFASMVIAVLVLYSYKPNPVMNSYAATAVILFVGCAWMGLSFLNHEYAVHKQIAVVHLRSAIKYRVGEILTLTLLTLTLALLIVAYPLATGQFPERAGAYRLVLAYAGHALMGLLGLSISLYLQSSWVPKSSHATGMLLAIIIVSVGGTQITSHLQGPFYPLRLLLPPAAPVMDVMMNADTLLFLELLPAVVQAIVYIALLMGFYLYRSWHRDFNKT